VFDPRAARGSVVEPKWRALYLAWVPINVAQKGGMCRERLRRGLLEAQGKASA
jgi:hypothetical protein